MFIFFGVFSSNRSIMGRTALSSSMIFDSVLESSSSGRFGSFNEMLPCLKMLPPVTTSPLNFHCRFLLIITSLSAAPSTTSESAPDTEEKISGKSMEEASKAAPNVGSDITETQEKSESSVSGGSEAGWSADDVSIDDDLADSELEENKIPTQIDEVTDLPDQISQINISADASKLQEVKSKEFNLTTADTEEKPSSESVNITPESASNVANDITEAQEAAVSDDSEAGWSADEISIDDDDIDDNTEASPVDDNVQNEFGERVEQATDIQIPEKNVHNVDEVVGSAGSEGGWSADELSLDSDENMEDDEPPIESTELSHNDLLNMCNTLDTITDIEVLKKVINIMVETKHANLSAGVRRLRELGDYITAARIALEIRNTHPAFFTMSSISAAFAWNQDS